ncbi:MAG: carbohydrate binding domain-containing protein [Armatimonadota bacterium]|nr:carbohydrate binding domain-containing protein [bacterium]
MREVNRVLRNARLGSSRNILGMLLVSLFLTLFCVGSLFGATRNLIPDAKFMTMPVGTVVTTTADTYAVGDWRFVNPGGTAGGLTVVPGGRDGSGRAITLSRTSTDNSVTVDLDNSRIPAVGKHKYVFTFWAKTNSGTDQTLSGIVAAFDGAAYLGNVGAESFTLTSSWAKYSVELTAPDDTTNLNPQLQLDTVGSVDIADLCLVDKATDLSLSSDGGFDSIPSGTSVTAEETTSVSDYWIFQNGTGANGSLSLITPGRDGSGQAVNFSRGTTTGWVALNNKPDISVTAGQSYRFMFWAKSSAGTPVLSKVASFDSSSLYIESTLVRVVNTSPEWTQYSYVYTAPANCAYAQIQFILNQDDSNYVGNIDVDDVSLEAMSALSSNVIPNPGFENFQTGTTWSTEGVYTVDEWRFINAEGSVASLSAVTPGHDGSGKALKFTRTSTGGYAWIDRDFVDGRLPATAGHRYRCSFWTRTDESTTQTVSMVVPWFSDAGYLGTQDTLNAIPTSEWTQYAMEITAPANAIEISPQLHVVSAGSAEFDDVCIVDITPNSISGSVIDSLSGQPLPGASISMQSLLCNGNLISSPGFEDCTVGKTYSNEGYNYFDSWAFYTYGSSGSAAVVSPGHNGSDAAVQITRTSTAHDVGLRQEYKNLGSLIAGHTYRMSVWLRSADAVPSQTGLTVDSYDSSNACTTWSFSCTPTSAWAQYSGEFVVPATAILSELTIRYAGVGSVLVDDVSIKETSATTTANTNGAYTLFAVPGVFTIDAAADGYAAMAIDPLPDGGASLTGKDFAMMPTERSWSVHDTFYRVDNTNLGTTEDSNALPWIKNGNGYASIFNNQMYLDETGSVNNGVCLGRGFRPTDFDLSVDMTMDDFIISDWVGIAYRQDAIRDGGDGYIVQWFPWLSNIGHVRLWCNGPQVGSDYDLDYLLPDFPESGKVTFKLSVHGASHKLWMNDTLIFDITDSTKTTGGYIGLYSDPSNKVYWDNFNASCAAPTDVNTVIDAKGMTDGTLVRIAEPLVATVASTVFSDGSYYVENVDRAYGIKVLHGFAASEGSRITGLAGTINTDSNGERYIDASNMTVTSGEPLGALGMANKSATESLAQSLLVKIWGNVTTVANDKSYLYIDDGSGISDGTVNVGIRVDNSTSNVQRVGAIAVGQSVAVTGVMGRATDGTIKINVIRPKYSLDVANTVTNTVNVTSADTSWIRQTASGTGTVAFATAPDSTYGTGAVLMTNAADGSTSVINFRTNLYAGVKLVDLSELSVSNYMTYFDIANPEARGIGARISLDLDGVLDTVEDIITCDPWNDRLTGACGYSRCALNKWVAFDALNVGRWYSGSGYAGSSDAGPFISIADYLAVYPDAKIASVSNGGLRFFMGGCTPHWDNVTGYLDNVRVGTVDGTAVYNFE